MQQLGGIKRVHRDRTEPVNEPMKGRIKDNLTENNRILIYFLNVKRKEKKFKRWNETGSKTPGGIRSYRFNLQSFNMLLIVVVVVVLL